LDIGNTINLNVSEFKNDNPSPEYIKNSQLNIEDLEGGGSGLDSTHDSEDSKNSRDYRNDSSE